MEATSDLSSHVSNISAANRREWSPASLPAYLGDRVSAAVSPRVIISKGVFAGEERVIRGEYLRLGSAPENTITLLDDDIGPNSVEIQFNRSFGGWTCEIRAIDDQVHLENGVCLLPGSKVRRNLPETVVIGAVEIQFFAPQMFPPNVKAGAFAIALALIAAVFFWKIDFQGNNAANIHSKIEGKSAKPQGKREEEVLSSSEFVKELTEVIFKNDFMRLVELRNSQDGGLEIGGIVPKENLDKWRKIERWIDSRNLPQRVARSLVIEDMSKLRVKVSGLTFGTINPAIITPDGQFLQYGDELANGWQIVSINEKKITVKKQKYEYQFVVSR